MKKLRYTDSHIFSILKQNAIGTSVPDLCRKHGMSDATLLLATQWLWTYNNERPHTAIGGVPPRQLLKAA